MEPGPGSAPEMPAATGEESNRFQSSQGTCLDPHNLLVCSRKASVAALLRDSHGDKPRAKDRFCLKEPPPSSWVNELRGCSSRERKAPASFLPQTGPAPVWTG